MDENLLLWTANIVTFLSALSSDNKILLFIPKFDKFAPLYPDTSFPDNVILNDIMSS
jgi:hypothetical protein